jgi:heat shock protein HslJ
MVHSNVKTRAPRMRRYYFCRSIAVVLVVAALTSVFSAPAQALDLVGSTWRVLDIGGQKVNENVHTTMEFVEAQRVSGLAGCNQYFGPISEAANTALFGNLATTRKMCPNAQMDQEQRFLQALSSVKHLQLSQDSQMLLLYTDGTEPVVRLTRVVDK